MLRRLKSFSLVWVKKGCTVGRLSDLPWVVDATYSRFFRRPTVGRFWGAWKSLVERAGGRVVFRLGGSGGIDRSEAGESTSLSPPVDRWVDIYYNVHARRRGGIEEIFADIWRNGDFCSIFAVANQARCARD